MLVRAHPEIPIFVSVRHVRVVASDSLPDLAAIERTIVELVLAVDDVRIEVRRSDRRIAGCCRSVYTMALRIPSFQLMNRALNQARRNSIVCVGGGM